MKLKKTTYLICGLTTTIVLASSFVVNAADAKAKYSVSDVMKAIHKGEDNIGKRVVGGKASKEDIDKLVEYYASLPLNEPPKGEKTSWNEKTGALVAAAKAVKEGKPGALDTFKSATNCKACHTAHRPEK